MVPNGRQDQPITKQSPRIKSTRMYCIVYICDMYYICICKYDVYIKYGVADDFRQLRLHGSRQPPLAAVERRRRRSRDMSMIDT